MELRQIKGPFSAYQQVTIPPETGHTWVHIGVQVPKTQPIAVPLTQVSLDKKTTTHTGNYRESYPILKVEINGDMYQLNECGILEFDGLSEIAWNLRFLTYMPPETIIDVVRE